jgi:hypothetical protein
MSTATRIRHGYGCPDWCDRPDDNRHQVDLQNGRAVIDHDGPAWGPYIRAGGMTYAETGEVAELDVTVSSDIADASLTPADLRRLAVDALAAADWLEKVTEAGR